MRKGGRDSEPAAQFRASSGNICARGILSRVPTQPRMKPGADIPVLAATSVTVAPANTKRTASNRCSTTDNATSANPDLPSPMPPRGHRTQVAEQRPVSSLNWHRIVKHLLAQDTPWQASACEDFHY